jgi:hypothetical protein
VGPFYLGGGDGGVESWRAVVLAARALLQHITGTLVLIEGWWRQLARWRKHLLAAATTVVSAVRSSRLELLLVAEDRIISGGGLLISAGGCGTTGRLLPMNGTSPGLGTTACRRRRRIIGVCTLPHFLCVHLLRPEVIRLTVVQLAYAGLWPRRLSATTPWDLMARLLSSVITGRRNSPSIVSLCHRVTPLIL